VLCKKAILQMPGLFCGSGRVRDAASIDKGNPGGVTPDVNVRFGDILVAFARGILSRDEVYDGVAAETNSSIEHVKNGIELPRERQRRRLSHLGLPSR
jgi:hypothetical protein